MKDERIETKTISFDMDDLDFILRKYTPSRIPKHIKPFFNFCNNTIEFHWESDGDTFEGPVDGSE